MDISGFSTARYATWFYLDQFKVLFDVGDGAATALAGKCQRIRHVFVSHADRDHLGGMIQFNQLAARAGTPLRYYFPKDSGSFPALRDFLEAFDPGLAKAEWVPVAAGDRIAIGKTHAVEIGENEHVAAASRGEASLTKSLDFALIESRRRLKPDLQGLDGREIAKRRAEHGEDAISDTVDFRLFGYSGDAPRFDRERWRGVGVLVHEATFIAPDEADRGHSELNGVIEGASDLALKALVLSHFSDRYDGPFIEAAIRQAGARFGVSFPIYAVLPRATVWDVLAGPPVWEGC